MVKMKTKKIHCKLESNQSQWLKLYVEFNKKYNRNRKNGGKLSVVQIDE